MNLINISNLYFSYDNNNQIINDLNFCLNKKEKVGIVGATGCGKSTLLYIIMGLIKPKSGNISIFNQYMKDESDFAKIRTKIGFMFQQSDDQLFSPTVIEDVVFGPLNQGKSKEKALNIALEIFELLEISYLQNRITNKLSGGEKKLVSLATALAMKPEILLLDEPLTGLDPQTRNKIISLLKDLSIPIIMVSHDWEALKEITKCFYTFSNGQLYLL